jgi:hypothetical protein
VSPHEEPRYPAESADRLLLTSDTNVA